METIDHLCKNYKGFPEMFQLMVDEWAPELSLSSQDIEKHVVIETFREFFSHEYDKEKADKLIEDPNVVQTQTNANRTFQSGWKSLLWMKIGGLHFVHSLRSTRTLCCLP